MKELDELITYIENDLIGKHKYIEIIDEAIKKYAELYHKKQLREKLKAFYKSIEDDYLYPDEIDMHIDDFLESN